MKTYDVSWKPCDTATAVFLLVEDQEPDSYKFAYYNMYGPLIKTEHFKTENRKVKHGKFEYYNKAGKLDSILSFKDNLPDGSWLYLGNTGQVILRKEFSKGKLQSTIDYLNKDTIANNKLREKDSLNHPETEAVFMNGTSSWRRFLSRNFRYPQRALSKKIEGTVNILFVVDLEGNLVDPVILASAEYSLDQETLRIMRSCPQWTPAQIDGKIIRSFKMQPITFSLNEGK